MSETIPAFFAVLIAFFIIIFFNNLQKIKPLIFRNKDQRLFYKDM